LSAGRAPCPGTNQWPTHLAAAVKAGKTSEANVTRSVKRALRPLFRAGRFDPVEQVRWAQLPAATVNSSEHQAAVYQAALQGITLLQNRNQTLPLSQKGRTKLAVLGPMAFVRDDMLSDYGDGDWRHQNACWNGPPGTAVRTLMRPIRAVLGLI
jgi:beta-glucosidase-like glycosyl hydrolase